MKRGNDDGSGTETKQHNKPTKMPFRRPDPRTRAHKRAGNKPFTDGSTDWIIKHSTQKITKLELT